MKRYSILNNLEYCYFCGRPANNIHEVFFGINRQTSIENGLCVGLCWECHLGNQGVHNDIEKDLELKQLYQREYEKKYGHEEFMKLIGKSYIY